ncbi:molecular chaperone TorD [Vibrio sp.]|uniref:molecular chaperone TorD n=1 Tax=Vibrio sp. TaxID=678 RepID=UPI003D0AA459
MQDIKAFNETRAEIYWWLSGLFSRALSQAELTQYYTADVQNFLAGLAANKTLTPAVKQLVLALEQLQRYPDKADILASDYTVLFAGKVPPLASPYAVDYQRRYEREIVVDKIEAIMSAHGIDIYHGLNDSADHVSVLLDFLGQMVIRSNELEQFKHMQDAFGQQQLFIGDYLLNWTPEFALRCQRGDPHGFYAAASALLNDFLRLDCEYLQDRTAD